MLNYLNIKNFVLIESAELNFVEGFNVITGETGAGKTLILNSLKFLLGEKSSKKFIGPHDKSCMVEGLFDVQDKNALKILREKELISNDQHEIIVRRILSQKGSGKIFINDQLCTQQTLREIIAELVQISSQHKNQDLLDQSFSYDLVNSFLSKKGLKILEEVQQNYTKIKTLIHRYKDLSELKEREIAQRIDYLKYQVEEFSKLSLEEGEYESLKKEFDAEDGKKNLEVIIKRINSTLYESEDTPVLSQLEDLRDKTSELNQGTLFDEILEKLNLAIESLDSIDIIIHSLNKNKQLFDSAKYIEMEKRLNTIEKMFIKYGNSTKEVLDYEKSIVEELETLENIEKEKKKIKNEIKILEENTKVLSQDLTKERIKISKDLSKKISLELNDLAMKESLFKVVVEKKPKLSAQGYDDIKLFIKTNKGQEFQELGKIASGGELSRITLILQKLIKDDHHVLIFDEIDTGIGGETSNLVGKKIQSLSLDNQILCITHSPQIAALSDQHFFICKESLEDSTKTTIKGLSSKEKMEEIARMLSGKVNKSSLDLAKKLISSK